MDNLSAKSYIRQMRREMENMTVDLAEIEKLINNPNCRDVFSSNAAGLAYYSDELKENRKYFNVAFRGLLEALTDDE